MRLFRRARRTWVPSWAVFPGVVGEHFAMYFVDVGACDAAPVATLPVRLDAVLLLAETSEEGMPAGRELRLVQEVDEQLGKRAERLGGAYLGRVISAGTVRFTCHLPELPGREIHLGDDRPVRITAAADPEWSYVRERLRPEPHQLHIVGDLSVVNALLERGDPLAVPRPVDHVGLFPAEAAARAAAAELRARGFTVTVATGSGRWTVEATRTDPVNPPEVHELTWTVRELCEQHGGRYDGWGCAVTRPTQ